MNAPNREVQQKIQDHYDRLSLPYRFYWGPHIHHGYWPRGASPRLDRLKEGMLCFEGMERAFRDSSLECGFFAAHLPGG